MTKLGYGLVPKMNVIVNKHSNNTYKDEMDKYKDKLMGNQNDNEIKDKNNYNYNYSNQANNVNGDIKERKHINFVQDVSVNDLDNKDQDTVLQDFNHYDQINGDRHANTNDYDSINNLVNLTKLKANSFMNN